jgi:hypothetical protein
MTHQENETLTAEQIETKREDRTAKTITDKLIKLPAEHQAIILLILKTCSYEQINNIYRVLDAVVVLARADSEPRTHGPTISKLSRLLNSKNTRS